MVYRVKKVKKFELFLDVIILELLILVIINLFLISKVVDVVELVFLGCFFFLVRYFLFVCLNICFVKN